MCVCISSWHSGGVCLVRGVGWVVGLLKSVGNIATNCAKELDTALKDTEILSLDATNQD